MPFPDEHKFIEAAELALGIKLPLSYKGRITPNNGGEINAAEDTWQVHPVFDTSDRKRINRTSNDICRETKAARHWARFPQTAVAFAANGTGDRLIFLPHPEDLIRLGETVYFWDHETGEVTQIAEDIADLD
jgi:hypothetical protein